MSNGSCHNERSEVAIPNSPYVERSEVKLRHLMRSLHYGQDKGWRKSKIPHSLMSSEVETSLRKPSTTIGIMAVGWSG